MKSRKFILKPEHKKKLRSWFLRVDPSKKLSIPAESKVHDRTLQSYDGKLLTCLDSDGYNILHEICHHLVASKENRKLPNWGLGESPFEKEECPVSKQTRDETESLQEELDCSALHLALSRLFGAKGWDLIMEADTIRVALPTQEVISSLQEKYPAALPFNVWDQLRDIHKKPTRDTCR